MFHGSYHALIIWTILGFYRLPQWLSGKESLEVQETQEMRVWSLGQKDPLEEEMAIQPCILAWRIPWTEETGGLQYKGSQKFRHDWPHTHIITKTWYLSPLEFSLYYANNYFQAKVMIFFFSFRNTRLPVSTLNFKRLFLRSHCFSTLHLAMALYAALEEYLVSSGRRQFYLESDHISPPLPKPPSSVIRIS